MKSNDVKPQSYQLLYCPMLAAYSLTTAFINQGSISSIQISSLFSTKTTKCYHQFEICFSFLFVGCIMAGMLEQLETLFGTQDVYKVFDVSKTASTEQSKGLITLL